MNLCEKFLQNSKGKKSLKAQLKSLRNPNKSHSRVLSVG